MTILLFYNMLNTLPSFYESGLILNSDSVFKSDWWARQDFAVSAYFACRDKIILSLCRAWPYKHKVV